MSTQNALQLAATIQNKVGASLISAQNLLPRAESAGVITQAGASSLGVFLLRDLKEMQRRTYECVEKVAKLLQSQLDIAEEKARRERDQAAELAKEKKPGYVGPMTGGTGAGNKKINNNLDDIEDAINKGTFAELLTGGLTTALLAPQALKNLGKGLGKRLLKGGIYGAVAGFIAGPIVDYINNEFDLELSDDDKKDLELSIIGAGVGLGVAGIPGALVGFTAGMAGKVASWIAGKSDATDVTEADFLGTAIGGSALAYWGTGKLASLMAMSTIPKVATLGAALGATPVLLGVGAAVALGVGATYLANKIDQYQEMTLEKLAKTTAKLDKEMGEWAAREEEGLFERFGINLGQLSALGEAKVATQEAMEQLGQDKKKFISDTGMQTKLTALADTLLTYSDKAIQDIMLDRTKANNFFDTVEAIKGIAAQGGFGEESKEVFAKMTAFSDKVQNVAKAQVSIGETGGVTKLVAENTFARSGDNMEKAAELEPKVQELLKKQAEAQEILRLATLARETEDAEQRERTLGTLRDIFSITDTELEKAERQARRDLTSITSQLNKANDTLQGLGVNFTFDQLKDLYRDDTEGLKELIERSVTQQGAAFVNAQNEANNLKSNPPSVNVTTIDQSDNKTISKSDTTISKSSPTGETYFATVGNNYSFADY